jgi:uncharacterized protein (DUF885 family)
MRKHSPILIAVFGLATAAAAQTTQYVPQIPTASEKLQALFDQRLQWQLHVYPSMAMRRGDYTDAGRLTDYGMDAIIQRYFDTRQCLKRLSVVPYDDLSKAEKLSYDLFKLGLDNEVESEQYRMFLAPVGGRFGTHQQIAQMAEQVRFRNYQDYVDYLTRLELVPGLVNQTIDLLALGAAEGRTPPRVTLAGLPGQFDALVAPGGGLSALAGPLGRMPQQITAARQKELRDRFDDVSMPGVILAVEALGDYITDVYLPQTRESIAAVDLPDGEAYYAYRLRVMTTTDMTAAEIHQLGLDQVRRIRAEMMQVIRSSDFMQRHAAGGSGDDDRLFDAFVNDLRTNPRFYHESADDLLTGYRDICKRVDEWLPKLFGVLPRLPYGVRPIPEFMAPNQTTAYYRRGDIRNSEAGIFFANTYGLDQRPKYEMIPLALHEAVPGHHLQVAIAQELDDVPDFRKGWGFTAFGEGWALYAERLGIEMGFYQDPYDDFGRLLYEMWRACRLVVDTGIHAFEWSRDRAIEFMVTNTALSRLNIETEVDRYIAWPGQACAYKIGELKIRELRATSERRLGDKFDLRAFHDVVLGAGSIPLTVLDKRVDFWINSQLIQPYD